MEKKEEVGLSAHEAAAGMVAAASVVGGTTSLYGTTTLNDRAIANLEKLAKEAAKVNGEAHRLDQVKKYTAEWNKAGLGKPFIAFKAMPFTAKLGVALAAGVAAIVAVLGVNRIRNCGCTHAEALEQERKAHNERTHN